VPASRNIPARGFVALAIMVALLNSTASSPLYAVYRELWSLDTFTISAVFATYAGGTLLALLVLGRLSDRLPDRRIVICGALLLVIAGSLVFGTASDLISFSAASSPVPEPAASPGRRARRFWSSIRSSTPAVRRRSRPRSSPSPARWGRSSPRPASRSISIRSACRS